MKRLVPYIAVIALAAAALSGCDRPKTAYNNSGASATPGSSTTGTTASTSSTTTTTTTSSDTTSPSAATTASTTTPSTGANVVTDTVTTGKIRTAFASDTGLKDTDITVKTEGGVVVLTGTAKSQDQITIATNLAQRQEGVTRVDTQVVVK